MMEQKNPFKMPRVLWFQLFLLALGYAFYSANRLSFGVGLKAVAASLSLTAVQLGTIGTIFTLGQALIDIPAGYLADRFGRKRMLIFGMVGLGCMTTCVTTSASFAGAALWRVCFGIFEGCWNIVMYSVAGSIFPAARAMLNGLMMTFYSIGAYVGPTYYGWSLERTGDWSVGLTHMGIATVIFGLLLIFGFKRKYTDTSTDIKRIHLIEAIRTVGFNKVVWLGVLIQILNIIPYWGFASMGPYLFMTYKGFNPTEAGSFFGAIYGIGGLSGVVLGFFADRFGRKPTIICLSGLNALCAFLIFHVIPQTSAVLYIVGGLMGIGLHAIYVLGYTIAQDGVSTSQIGLATGQVDEIYHPGYVAKRMEIGAVVGATPASHVRRECPAPGDVIVLLGGRTGRDGIGGATGSSKAHKLDSLEHCGAEVQKGNAPIERKLQRLFRREDACKMIKRCNDFGAGGVSVAIGELADGLYIDLNKVTKKYEGLDGTELAISESQERMAVALAPEDVDKFIAIATEENLEATPVAKVTEEKRLNMVWNGVSIVNISREFLNSNGAEKHQNVHVEKGSVWQPQWAGLTFSQKMKSMVGDLNVCSKKGLSERFDSTIGAATVLMPFGGAYQLTPQNAMVAKLPVDGETTTCSGMAWGYNPYLMSANQYVGARMAVIESVTKLVATGFRYEDAYLTFQEYFERLGNKPERWGKPLAALLGALDAQIGLGIASIGGKDSMSGSFEQLDVPPTLVSFATAIGKASRVVSTEFKKPESTVVLVRPIIDPETGCPNFFSLKANYKIVENMIEEGMVASACSVGYGGIAEALFKMGLGNHIGFKMRADMTTHQMFEPMYGSIILEMVSDSPAGMLLGETTKEYTFESCGEKLDMAELQEIWESKLEPVYPYRKAGPAVEKINGSLTAPAAPKIGVAKPKVIIPVFPGTNCEYDTAKAFARAGADPEILVVRNLTPADVAESCEALVKAIDASQIVMLPGGFSGGDEPDGSAKFIASFFRNPAVTEAVRRLLQQRDGLMLGICNGFQALIKLGLVPYGDIRPITACDPTLTFNTIGRHQSMLVHTRVASTGSPWLSKCEVGEMHTIAISHGEGRFVAPQEVLDTMLRNGQVATQYVDLTGVPTMDQSFNPNGSVLAIEGITSPDGRVFGKMGHSERSGEYLYKNVTGDKYQPIFEGGVDYFKV